MSAQVSENRMSLRGKSFGLFLTAFVLLLAASPVQAGMIVSEIHEPFVFDLAVERSAGTSADSTPSYPVEEDEKPRFASSGSMASPPDQGGASSASIHVVCSLGSAFRDAALAARFYGKVSIHFPAPYLQGLLRPPRHA